MWLNHLILTAAVAVTISAQTQEWPCDKGIIGSLLAWKDRPLGTFSDGGNGCKPGPIACPLGKVPAEDNKSCVCKAPTISDGNNGCKAAPVTCQGPKVPNVAGTECVCKAGDDKIGTDSSFTCSPPCPKFEKRNDATGTCDCIAAYERPGGSNTPCVKTCGSQEIRDNTSGNCICKSDYEKVKDVCERKCVQPEVRDSISGACVCGDGLVKGKLTPCILPCGLNEVRNPNSDACDCAGGHERGVSQNCIPVCERFSARRPNSDVCDCVSNYEKPSGYDFCLEACGANEERDQFLQCVCKFGFKKDPTGKCASNSRELVVNGDFENGFASWSQYAGGKWAAKDNAAQYQVDTGCSARSCPYGGMIQVFSSDYAAYTRWRLRARVQVNMGASTSCKVQILLLRQGSGYTVWSRTVTSTTTIDVDQIGSSPYEFSMIGIEVYPSGPDFEAMADNISLIIET